jgi:peroxidase
MAFASRQTRSPHLSTAQTSTVPPQNSPAELRSTDGSGRLKTSEGNLLPFNVNGFDNAPSNSPNFFLAGDFRANEQIALTAMHTLFMREHNSWADAIAQQNPQLTGDEIYELARMIVSAEIQSITYNEFLPAMLGNNAIRLYRDY